MMINRRDSDIKIDPYKSNLLDGKRFDVKHVTLFKKLLIKINESNGKIVFEDWNTLFMFFNTYRLYMYPKLFIMYYSKFKLKINKVYFGNTNYYFKFTEEINNINDNSIFERINFFNQHPIEKILSVFMTEEIKQSNNQDTKYNIQINDTIYTFFEWRMLFETTNYLNIENKNILYDDKLISFYKTYKDIIDLYYFNDLNNIFCFSYDVNVDFEIDFPKKFKDYISSL